MRSPTDRGQATVELALALPVVVLLALGLVQLLAVAADQLAVELAARDAARAAAVSADPAGAAVAAAGAATRIAPLLVDTTIVGDRVSVTVTHRSSTGLPLVGALIGEFEVRATVTMALEPPGMTPP